MSANAWSSRWALGTVALLLAGGSALPGTDLGPVEPAPAPVVEVPIEETVGPVEDPSEEPTPDGPADSVPTEPPADEPAAEEPPAQQPPAEDAPTEEPEQAGPVLVVVPEPVRSVVDGAPGYILPLGEGGFAWLVDGVRVDALGAAARLVESPDGSWYELSAAALGRDVDHLVVAVVADPDHALLGPDGVTFQTRSVIDPRVAAELAAPTALDGAGREDTVIVPDVVAQVVRDAAGDVLDAGSHPVTAEYVDGVATVDLTVTAAQGHRLEVDGTPVESVPGAGGTWAVTLTLTDAPPPEVEPVPSPDETAQPAPTVPASPAATPVEEPAAQLDLTAPLLTVTAAAEPAADADPDPEPEPQAAQTVALQELPESGPEGLGLIAMLGGFLLGGAWLVLGMRGD